MPLRTRQVSLKQLPPSMDEQSTRRFYRELESSLNVDRPYLVLDCSALHELNSDSIYLLLCCLEEAMKRNGDVRLAGVSRNARQALQRSGTDTLFQIFDSPREAAESFSRFRVDCAAQNFPIPSSQQASEDAA